MLIANTKYTRGFTVVELLIVIVVIAILATITVVVYKGVQDRGKNAVRKQDMSLLTDRLDLYYSENGAYPHSGGCLSSPWWNRWGAGSSTGRLMPVSYIETMPQDPGFVDNGACASPNSFLTRAYWYISRADDQGYLLGTYMPGLSASDANYLNTNGAYGCGNFMNWAILKNYP